VTEDDARTKICAETIALDTPKLCVGSACFAFRSNGPVVKGPSNKLMQTGCYCGKLTVPS
jgi:hypothetical protein